MMSCLMLRRGWRLKRCVVCTIMGGAASRGEFVRGIRFRRDMRVLFTWARCCFRSSVSIASKQAMAFKESGEAATCSLAVSEWR
jgi:hypothetical protein